MRWTAPERSGRCPWRPWRFEGWAWNGVTPLSSGGVYGSLTESQVEVGAADTVPVVSFRVTCVPDANAYLDSVERMQESGLNAENSLVSVAPIGDRVVAWRTEAEYANRVTIEWAPGADVLASVMADAEVDSTSRRGLRPSARRDAAVTHGVEGSAVAECDHGLRQPSGAMGDGAAGIGRSKLLTAGGSKPRMEAIRSRGKGRMDTSPAGRVRPIRPWRTMSAIALTLVLVVTIPAASTVAASPTACLAVNVDNG